MTTNNNQALSEYDRDKIRKQKLVLETIASCCAATSPHQDLRTVASALEAGKAVLDIENLSGGYSNYTYKVFLAPKSGDVDEGETSATPDTALFVKLCFPKALWNPDENYVYDLRRIANEAAMMEKFAELAPGCVATPYLLLDIDDMKLLATQWSPADEQLGNQCVDGICDPRVARNLASAIAALHCSDLDPDFNTETRDCMISVFPFIRDELLEMVQSSACKSDNRAAVLVREIGADKCTKLFDLAEESYRERLVPCHSDLHAFNILVEKKPNVLYMDRFGEKGSFCICDWEMAMSGPPGLDMGRVYSIPVACIIAHSIGGNCEVAGGMVEFLNIYWEEYSSSLTKLGGRNAAFLHRSYRNAMGWLGWKLVAMCHFEWFFPFLPIDASNFGVFKESLRVIGLTLLCMGFGEHEEALSLDELQKCLASTITNEVSHIKSTRRVSGRRRRSSVLREKNRRVSDDFLGLSRKSLLKLMEMDEMSAADDH